MKAKLVFQKQNFSKARSPLLNNLEVWQLQERLTFKLILAFRKQKNNLGNNTQYAKQILVKSKLKSKRFGKTCISNSLFIYLFIVKIKNA